METKQKRPVVCNKFQEKVGGTFCKLCAQPAKQHISADKFYSNQNKILFLNEFEKRKKTGFYDGQSVVRKHLSSIGSDESNVKKIEVFKNLCFDCISFPMTYKTMHPQLKNSIQSKLSEYAKKNFPKLGSSNPALWVPFVIHHLNIIEQRHKSVPLSSKL